MQTCTWLYQAQIIWRKEAQGTLFVGPATTLEFLDELNSFSNVTDLLFQLLLSQWHTPAPLCLSRTIQRMGSSKLEQPFMCLNMLMANNSKQSTNFSRDLSTLYITP